MVNLNQLSGTVFIVQQAGNVGIGTVTPQHRLEVAGAIRSTSGGFVFPDGTVQATAAGGGGNPTYWVANGGDIYYGGGVGIGASQITPGASLEVAGGAVRVGGRVAIDSAGFALYG